MHYYIDGYNLLFRSQQSGEEFKEQRQRIILDLSKKIDLLEIDATLVFDATYQIGEASRSHYKQLEIVFTDEGETADEYIVNELKATSNPSQETVVTSDKKLAWYARRLSAKTEPVEKFIAWLNQRYKNKIQQLKKSKAEPKVPLKKAVPLKPKVPIPTPNTPSTSVTAEECFEYYLNAFEIEYQEIEKQSSEVKETKKTEKKASKQKKKPKIPQKKEESPLSEFERWLRLFETD